MAVLLLIGDLLDPAARAALEAGGVVVRAEGPADVVLAASAAELGAAREALPDAAAILAIEPAQAATLAPDGADDFVLRPVRGDELLARVRLVLWRTRRIEAEGIVRAGDLAIDTRRHEVRLGGQRVDLTLKEYELLLFLAQHPSDVFTREVLLQRIWGETTFGGTRTVDVHIRRIRFKIERHGHVFIDTVRGVGYKFLMP